MYCSCSHAYIVSHRDVVIALAIAFAPYVGPQTGWAVFLVGCDVEFDTLQIPAVRFRDVGFEASFNLVLNCLLHRSNPVFDPILRCFAPDLNYRIICYGNYIIEGSMNYIIRNRNSIM
jgi:hypothetical protein